MYKVRFDTGQEIQFEKEPTHADIEEASRQLKLQPVTKKQTSQIKQDVQSVLGDNVASDIVSGVGQFGAGVGSSILKGGLGLAQTALKGVQKAKESPTTSPLLRAIPNTQGAQQALSNVKQKFSDVYAPETKSIPGQAGNLTGEIAQYATGNAPIVKGQQFLRGIADTALKNAPGVAKFAGRTASRVIPEAGISAGMEYAKSGGNAEQAKEAGTFAGVASGIFGALGDVYRTAFKPSTKEALQKALGVQGKQTASRALEDTDKKLEGFQVMKEYSPNIKIKDLDGVEKNFDPNNATFTDTLQAWEQSRKLAFKEYSDIAKKASGKGLEVDLQPVIDELLAANSQPSSSQTKRAIIGAYNDLIENFTSVDDTGNRILIGDPERLETYIADLNKVARGVFQGTSDRATAEVAANVVSKLREIIDDAISKQGGGQYQVARNKYAALKSIENDLVRRFKQMNRKIGNGLYDYSDIFLSGDIISGIVANEPGLLVMGLTGKAVSSALKKMKDPERYLRQVFQGLDDATPPSLTKQRLFGSPKDTPTYKEGVEVINGKKNLKNSVENKLNTTSNSSGKAQISPIVKIAGATAPLSAMAITGRKISDKLQEKNDKIIAEKYPTPEPINYTGNRSISNTLMQLESSGGKDKRSADKGEYKWLTGLTPIAIKHLKEKGIKKSVDVSSKKDVLDASVKYFRLLMKENPKMTPAEVYVYKYWTQAKSKEEANKKIAQFNKLIK